MILVRHGQSEFNAAFNVTRIDPGIRDPKLTRMARAVGDPDVVALGRRRVIVDAEKLPEQDTQDVGPLRKISGRVLNEQHA